MKKQRSGPVRPAQRGGTFLGFAFGVVVGLGVALAVAVYVTKVPVPFVDKGVVRSAEQEKNEAERNKGWNPNAQIGGGRGDTKTAPAVPVPTPDAEGSIVVTPGAAPEQAPAKPVPEAKAPESKAPTPPADAKTAKPESKPESKPAKPGASDDPLGDLVRSRVGTAAAPEPFIYFVQAGAYRSPDDAETQRAKLAMLGFNAQVTEREQSGRPVYRVRVGPFKQLNQAEGAVEQLGGHGVESALVRVQQAEEPVKR